MNFIALIQKVFQNWTTLKANYAAGGTVLLGLTGVYLWADAEGYIDQVIQVVCQEGGKDKLLLFLSGAVVATVASTGTTHVLSPKTPKTKTLSGKPINEYPTGKNAGSKTGKG